MPSIKINSPFHCDYGFNIHIKNNVFINYGTYILDSSPILIGNNVNIAPNVCISCVGHAINPIKRRQGVLISSPIIIGDNVWIGANSFINGGVKIGNNSVIGAGSIVTKNVLQNSLCFGDPCQFIKKI